MATAAQLIDETQALLQSWGLDQSQSSTLTSIMTPSSLSFTFDSSAGIATGMTAGRVEIDRELLYVGDLTTSSATVPAWGRGFQSTSAVAHQVGTRIVSQPTFPRQKTLDVINQQLERIFPKIFVVKSYETVVTTPQLTYDLPDTAHWVVDAKWNRPDGRNYWEPVRRWRVSQGLGTLSGDGLNGITVDVGDVMMTGRPLQFLYATKPTPLVNDTDDFVGVTGLPAGLIDVVELGAAAQLSSGLEASRAQVGAVEQQNRNGQIPGGTALNVSKFFNARFNERLEEERKSLQRRFPPHITYQWR